MIRESVRGSEGAGVAAHLPTAEKGKWKCAWTLEKFLGDDLTAPPQEVVEGSGNILVNAGIALLEDLLIGAGGTVFNNANAFIGVGDSATAATASQTNLQATTNLLRKAMDATFPSRAAQTITFRSTFGTSEANFTWNEFGVFNASSGGTMLNRAVSSLGTKTSAASWVFTVTITIS